MANAALIEKYRQETREVIEEVLRDGSDPEAWYLIEHHLSCKDVRQLDTLIAEAFRAGFEVDEPEEMELEDGSILYCCDLVTDSTLKAELIDRQVEKVLDLAEKYQVDYDGWGTWFEDPEEDEDDDEHEGDEEDEDEDDYDDEDDDEDNNDEQTDKPTRY